MFISHAGNLALLPHSIEFEVEFELQLEFSIIDAIDKLHKTLRIAYTQRSPIQTNTINECK